MPKELEKKRNRRASQREELWQSERKLSRSAVARGKHVCMFEEGRNHLIERFFSAATRGKRV